MVLIGSIIHRQLGRAHLIRQFGPDCFEDDRAGSRVGQFWSLLETRPYMRILQATVRLTFEIRDYRKSA